MNTSAVSNGKNILLTGASGLIGSALCGALEAAGYKVYPLARNQSTAPFSYSEETCRVQLNSDIPLFAVINLAGPNISDGRWTTARKKYLLHSRINLTQALASGIAELPCKPDIFLSASAIGYYGLTGENTVDENSAAGTDFLAEIGTRWEQSTRPAELAGINTLHLRFGVVLSASGGMLKKLLLPFKLGLGGKIGNGRQYLSWISVEDVQQIVLHLLQTNPPAGAINLVAEEPVTNQEFSQQLGHALNRPAVLPMPAPVAKLLFGEMGETLLLGSSRVKSIKHDSLGITLRHPTIDKALQDILKKN